MNTYNIDLFYSDEDNGWIARLSNAHGISAFGETRGVALLHLAFAIKLVEEVEKEDAQ